MSYTFHPVAEVEHLEAIGYFESKRPGLGASYLGDFESTMIKVCDSPQRYPSEGRLDKTGLTQTVQRYVALGLERDAALPE